MMTQHEIAKFLEVSQTSINFVLTGKRPVTRPLAEKLTERFPWKTYQEWRAAKPKDIRLAFKTLDNFKKLMGND